MKTPKMIASQWANTPAQKVTPWMVEWVCYSIIDLWSQEMEWKWEIKVNRKFQLTFETEQMGTFTDKDTGVDVEKPLIIGKRYTLSLHEKAILKKDLTSWLGKEPEDDINIFDLLGKNALLQVIENESNGKVYSNINAIMPSKANNKPKNDTVWFSLEKEYYDEKTLEELPKWLKETIKKSPEYDTVSDDTQDDVEF